MGEGNVRSQVNSQSVDRIYACCIDYTPTRGVVPAETAIAITNAEVGTVAEMYCTRALRSRVKTGDGLGNTNGGQYYFTLGGVQLPAFHPCLADWYSITKCNLPKPHPRATVVPGTFGSYRLWHNNAWKICMRLCAANSDLKHVSGLYTRNIALDGMLTGYDGAGRVGREHRGAAGHARPRSAAGPLDQLDRRRQVGHKNKRWPAAPVEDGAGQDAGRQQEARDPHGQVRVHGSSP
jgi:hypothetical protein